MCCYQGICGGTKFPWFDSKLMIIGPAMFEDNRQPLAVDDGLIEWVDHFPYLGSVIADERKIDLEVNKRMANASRALHHSVFVITICPSKPSGMCTRFNSSIRH